MPDRAEILALIDRAYAARMAGDLAGMASVMAPDASFRIAGRPELFGHAPFVEGNAEAETAGLMERFQFHDLERLHAVVEGDSATIHWRVRVSTGGGTPVETEIHDLWKIGPDGKAQSLVQFADTALVAHLIAGAGPG